MSQSKKRWCFAAMNFTSLQTAKMILNSLIKESGLMQAKGDTINAGQII